MSNKQHTPIDVDGLIDEVDNMESQEVEESSQPAWASLTSLVRTAYFLGGTGTKIAYKMRSNGYLNKALKPYIIDTSTSEAALIDNAEHLLIRTEDDKEGSGSVRSINADAIAKNVPNLMATTEPSDINFVIFSASGGTGGTASYSVIKDLLEKDKSVLAFISIDYSNQRRAMNAMKTLVSLHRLALEFGVIIPIYIGSEPDLDKQDEGTIQAIKMANVFLARGIVGIDDRDREVFLNPVLSGDEDISPGLVSLHYAQEKGDYASAIVLTKLGGPEGHASGTNTIFTGVLSDEVKKYFALENDDPVALVTSSFVPYQTISFLKDTYTKLKASASNSRRVQAEAKRKLSYLDGKGQDI